MHPTKGQTKSACHPDIEKGTKKQISNPKTNLPVKSKIKGLRNFYKT